MVCFPIVVILAAGWVTPMIAIPWVLLIFGIICFVIYIVITKGYEMYLVHVCLYTDRYLFLQFTLV